MRFFQAAFFIFGLSSAVCALATPAGLHAADELAPLDVDSFDAEALDIEARNVEEEADELAPLDIEARYVEEEADEFAPLDMEARNIEEEADEFAPLDAEAVDVDALDIEGPIDVTRSIKASNIAARKVEEEAEELQALHEAYDLERRDPARNRLRPTRPQRDSGCKKANEFCSTDSQCCSKSCEPTTNTCDEY